MQPLSILRRAVSEVDVKKYVQDILGLLVNVLEPSFAYLVGSAVQDKMTDQSDLDFVRKPNLSGICFVAKELER